MEILVLILQVAVLLGAIFIGIRLGGMAIGYAGGFGVVVLCLLLGMKPGAIPWDVILIIMSVIAAIAAMQLAGGLDYMVQVAEKILRKNPKYINYLAPTVTYFLTFLAGTGHTAFSMIPVIVEVAKEQNVKPSAPLSIAVVSSQIAITASPVSAAVVYMTGVLEPLGWSYPTLLLVWLITTFSACMLTAFVVSKFFPLDLSKDPVYQERLKAELVKPTNGAAHIELRKGAKLSVGIFLAGVLCVVVYATSISDVVRQPMLNFVSKNIPVHVDKELDLITRDANNLLAIKDVEQLKAEKQNLATPLEMVKKVYIDSIPAIKANPNEIQKLQSAFTTAKVEIESIAKNEQNKKAIELIESRLDSLSKNLVSILPDFAKKDGVLADLSVMVKSYIDPVRLPRDGAIMSFMLMIATLIVIFCKVETGKLLDASTFKAGMTACVCVLGVAWLGNTFVDGYKEEIGNLAGKLVGDYPALLAVALFFASMLLYSQAATAKAIMPVVIAALGINATNADSAYILVASFAAVSALFVLPTYPTLLGAVQMDDTGSTRIGKFVFNHSFILPGIIAVAFAVALGFIVVPMFA
ncbi:MAG: anaerobic C4-dicarboxylate transporter [Helicobacter trogontum]|uniref:C4-dicarboxylate transporter DcuA n=1 Tax=Helicobacter trogontum TaxID=50960 RepID=A0A4U8T8S7_9HELI|nr:anaerobic C4-dicarboxylate transporter [Helicobacter trogontum]MDY5184677.1 anaerobic C4-dicarboxylate transporter [Helicobacter trogontum]TLD96119.1 anaerobic C4-dicarboxylate transporter [Helicobacter trogontum]